MVHPPRFPAETSPAGLHGAGQTTSGQYVLACVVWKPSSFAALEAMTSPLGSAWEPRGNRVGTGGRHRPVWREKGRKEGDVGCRMYRLIYDVYIHILHRYEREIGVLVGGWIELCVV